METLNLKDIKIEREGYEGYVNLSFQCPNCGEIIEELSNSAIEAGRTTILYKGKITCECVENQPVTIVAIPDENKVALYWGTLPPQIGFLWNPVNMFVDKLFFHIYKLTVFMFIVTIGKVICKLLGVTNDSFRKTDL